MRLRDIAISDSKFFLKSEYDPFSSSWPALAFTPMRVKTYLDKHCAAGRDFIMLAGVKTARTENPAHRGRLMSVVQIDPAEVVDTATALPRETWTRAQQQYPGQWERSLRITRGWSFSTLPVCKLVLPVSYPRIGQGANRGGLLEIDPTEREAVLDLAVEPVSL